MSRLTCAVLRFPLRFGARATRLHVMSENTTPDLLEYRRAAERRVLRCAYDLLLAQQNAYMKQGTLTHVCGPGEHLIEQATRDLLAAVAALSLGLIADARDVSVSGLDRLFARATEQAACEAGEA